MKKLFFLSLLIIFSSDAFSEPVDGIVATAGDKIFTYSEVLTESKLALLMRAKGSYFTLPIGGDFSREVLDRMINIELIFKEARRMGFKAEGTDILEEMLALKEAFYYDGDFLLFMEQEAITMDDLVQILSKRKIVEAFVADRLKLVSHVSPKEVLEEFEKEKELYGGSDLKDVESAIRRTLENRKGAAFLDRWIKDIRARAEVRYLDFSSLHPSQK